jgi:hypothetical protein
VFKAKAGGLKPVRDRRSLGVSRGFFGIKRAGSF